MYAGSGTNHAEGLRQFGLRLLVTTSNLNGLSLVANRSPQAPKCQLTVSRKRQCATKLSSPS